MTRAGPHPPDSPPGRCSRLRALDCTPFLAVALLTLTLLVLVPAQVYLVNRSAVLVFFREVLLSTVILASGVIIVLTGLLAIIPAASRRRITVLLLGVSFLFWFHAYCLVWPYAVLDGGDIPWETYAGRGVIDAILWVLVLGSLLRFTSRVYPRAGLACVGLLLIQFASLGISTSRAYVSPLDLFKHYYVEKEAVFDYSTNKNVILIVLDEFQSDIFAEAVLPQPGLRAHFTGFTYFPDTTAGANFTELALPAILTGSIYDNGTPRDQYLRKAYLDHSLPATLKRAGFDVHLFPWRGFANESIYYHEDVASNFKRRPRPLADKLGDVCRLVDLGVFRSMPQFAKRYVYDDSKWWLSDLFTRALARHRAASRSAAHAGANTQPGEIGPSLTLDNIFTELARNHPLPGKGMTAHAGPGAFKFYHLAGLHVPVKLKRDFTTGVFDYTRANFNEQAEAYVKIMGAYLDELKRHNLYDNSMIVILGDHGSGRAPELYVRPGSPELTGRLNATAVRGDFQCDKARGIPLLLVKRFGEKGELKTSQASASVVDIPATVRKELNLAHPPVQAIAGQPDFHGVSLFDLNENRTRPRYYGAMSWSGEKSDYVNPITLYRIQGFGWSDESWSFVKFLDPQR